MADSKELCSISNKGSIKKPKNSPHRSGKDDSLYLPHEIIVEIFSRLPVKTLLQLRSLSKSFKSLISDGQFIKTHLLNSHFHRIALLDDKHYLRIKLNYEFSYIKSCSILTLLNNSCAGNAIDLDSYQLKKEFGYGLIVGSYNGLLCFARKHSVVLVNPSIRVFNELPLLQCEEKPCSFTVFGFGYDCEIDDYKVVAVCGSNDNSTTGSVIHVFTLKTNCWRSIGSFGYGVPYNVPGKCVNGTLNWLVKCVGTGTIVSFDLAKESYKAILEPDYGGFVSNRILGVLDVSLCILCSSAHDLVDLWVMKDHGIRDSWFKMVRVRDPGLAIYSVPNYVGKNEEILLELNFSLVIYNPRENTLKYPVINGCHYWSKSEVYVESLVSPIVGN